MTLPTDKAGLRADSDLDMVETEGTVVLKPANQSPALSRKNELLVYTGEIPTSFDAVRAIEEDREKRMRKTWGA